MPHYPGGPLGGDQRWSTFVANHPKGIVVCDFLTVVTATFKCLYVLGIIELGTRKLLHLHVTDHPTAARTQQQLREAIPSGHDYRALIHDRDSIFSSQLAQSMTHMGLRVLRTPYRSPKANSICERVIGTLRRECLDFLIPLTEHHLRMLLKNWLTHDNHGRPHCSIGPGIPDPPAGLSVARQEDRHRIPGHLKVVSHPVLGGLHHEYGLKTAAA